MRPNKKLPPEFLQRAQALDEKIKSAMGAPISSENQKELIREMLLLRVEEIILKERVSKEFAIQKAHQEFAVYHEIEEKTAKKENEQHLKSIDFIYLDQVKAELLNELKETEKEDDNKKKEKENENEKTDLKSDNSASNADYNPIDGLGSYRESSNENNIPDADAARSAIINFSGYGSGVREFASPRNELPPVGRTSNSTTLDFNGIRATVYHSGVHREMRIDLPKNATPEQKESYNKACDAAREYGKGSYSLLSHNCVGAVDTALNALNPNLTDGSGRMPWPLDRRIENELNRQLAQTPAIANGNITNNQGEIKSPVSRGAQLENENKTSAPRPTPPGFSKA